jgi:hypothetical protein
MMERTPNIRCTILCSITTLARRHKVVFIAGLSFEEDSSDSQSNDPAQLELDVVPSTSEFSVSCLRCVGGSYVVKW